MKTKTRPSGYARKLIRYLAALTCMAVLLPVNPLVFARHAPGPIEDQPVTIPPEKLDSLVAPIALYPDSLLGQVLVASTYPLELVQLSQWLEKNKNLQPKQISEAVLKQDWDPSVQAMAVFPSVVKNMTENIRWTADLGNAFLAQQGDLMEAVQRMRMRAKDDGKLKSSEQQKVETQVVENKTVVVIEPSSPE